MIVKVAELDKSIKSSFRRLSAYIANEQVSSDLNIRNVGAWIEPNSVYDIDDLDLFIDDVESVQSMSKATSDKTYHLIVSFGVEERPSAEILQSISNELVNSLGFDKHQRLTVIHDDTDNLHLHIAINKIDPEKFTIHEPYYPYKTLSKKAQELEIKYNLNQTHSQNKEKENICSVANDIDSRPTQESFKTYISNIDLSDCKNWEDFHDRLKTNGVTYSKYGSGAVFKDLTDEKINIKASAVKREYSLTSLEKKYGKFRESSSEKAIENSYSRYKDLSLKEQYDLININRKMKSKEEKQVIREEYKQIMKPSQDIIDNLSRITGTTELDRILIRMNKKSKEKSRQKTLKNQRKSEMNLITNKYKYFTYDAWLQEQALTNEKAELALKNIKDSRINYIKGDFKPLKNQSLKITKNGTYILNNGLKANHQSIFLKPNNSSIQKTLEVLNNSNVTPQNINGTEEFKNKMIDIIATRDINIVFQDEELNKKILAAKISKQDNLLAYINEKNKSITNYEKFNGKEQEYIFQGYEKYHNKFLLKFKSLHSNTIYIKEPVQEDYNALKDIKKGEIIKVISPIKNSYEIESYITEKEQKKYIFKELDIFDNSMKKISTKEYNGQKLYLYKKDNDTSIYVSKFVHQKEKIKEKSAEQENQKSKTKNKGLER